MQQDEVWQAVLGEIEVTLSHGNFVTWFKNTRLVKRSDGAIVVGVTNPFIKTTLEKKYGDLIVKTLRNQGIKVEQVEYKTVSAPKTLDEQIATNEQVLATETPQLVAQGVVRPPAARGLRQSLNERYTLDNFVVGDGNDLAFAACQAVVAQPGTKYNPLYLYGGVGIGKTHLIQAVGNALQSRHPDARILYITTEQFVREFVQALRDRTASKFADYYRSADVLIVDDVQFLAGKDKIQEEFFHTFNSLHQANKQIIMSSDKPPSSIAMLPERLKSRFGGGMIIDMQVPDYETRCAIIQTKAENQHSELEPEVVEYLASSIQTNIRDLEGALNQLLAWCEVRGLIPTPALAADLLQVNKNRPKHFSAKQIIERTARHFQIPLEDIVGPKRDKDIVVPRQVAMYILHEELHLSYPKIASELGRKDHTTAMHSVRKITQELQADTSLRDAVSEIKEYLHV